MPVAAVTSVRLRAEDPAPHAALRLWVDAPAPAIAYTVDAATAQAFAAPQRTVGVRVTLGEVDVTDSLVGEVTVDEARGSLTARADFALHGVEHLPHRTLTTWTRTPVTVHHQVAEIGGPVIEQLAFEGLVETCRVGGRQTQVQARSRLMAAETATSCLAVPPDAGLTRGEILRRVVAGADLDADVPEGAVYTKPLEVAGAEIGRWAQEFAEPEGWELHDRGGVLTAEVPQLRLPPEPPDHTWSAGDLDAPPELTPPADVPSTYVVRGTAITLTDEAGFTTEIEVSTAKAVYAPAVAVDRQTSSGTLEATGFVSIGALRTVSEVITESTKLGSRLVRQVITEKGWRNPEAAKAETAGPVLEGGPADHGLYYTTAFVDSDGRYVTWTRQKYGVISRQEVDVFYDAQGTETGQRLQVDRYFKRRRALRHAASPGAGYASSSTYLGSDGATYRGAGQGDRIETFGRAELQLASYAYGDDGARREEVVDVYGWLAIPASINETSGFYINGDGRGQASIDAFWQRTRSTTRRQHVDGSGRLRGETDIVAEHVVAEVVGGSEDFGDVESNAATARFVVADVRQRSFRVITADTYQVVELSGTSDNARSEPPRTESGKPPVPVFLSSSWQQIVRSPLEVVLHDDLVVEWFGPRIEVIDHPHLQTLAEAEAMARRRQRRDLAMELRVTRRDAGARLYDTVRLIDRDRALDLRCLVVGVGTRYSLSPPKAQATYVLEGPFL